MSPMERLTVMISNRITTLYINESLILLVISHSQALRTM